MERPTVEVILNLIVPDGHHGWLVDPWTYVCHHWRPSGKVRNYLWLPAFGVCLNWPPGHAAVGQSNETFSTFLCCQTFPNRSVAMIHGKCGRFQPRRCGSAVKWWNEQINEIKRSRVRSPSPGNFLKTFSHVEMALCRWPQWIRLVLQNVTDGKRRGLFCSSWGRFDKLSSTTIYRGNFKMVESTWM
jgi:hypothetical protein